MNAVEQYARDVVYGELRDMCCKWEILACERHLRDLERSRTDPSFPYVFDESRAERIFRHMEGLRRLDAPEEYIRLEPWQKFDDGSIFGWVERTTGKRRFSISYRRIARGHAKTTNAAAVGLYAMCGDALYPPGHPEEAKYESQPLVAVVAVDREQGKNTSWGDIRKMAEANPQIAKRLDVKKTYIRHKTRGGDVRLYSKDTKNKSGDRPSMIILEEWHEHQTSAVRDRAASGMGKKWQCLEYIITTAGTDAENKPCYRDDCYYKRVLSGDAEQDDVFIMIRELDEEDDPHDERVWCKANPFFRGVMDADGVRRRSDYAETLYKRVKSEHDYAYNTGDPAKIREFLIMRMNRWQTDSENKYFSGCMDKFREGDVGREKLEELLRGTRGHYGFDLGKTRDLSGSAYVTFLADGRLAVCIHGFLPQNRAVEHEHSDRIEYLAWAKDGWVTLTPGDVTDNAYVERWIAEHDKMKWGCEEIDYDGHNAVDMAIRMRAVYGDDHVVEIPQTCAGQNQATKRFRELVLQGKVVHDGSPLLYWCLSNAVEISDNYGDIKLSKRHKDDTQRIDPVAAMMNALARLIVKADNHVNASDILKRRGYGLR